MCSEAILFRGFMFDVDEFLKISDKSIDDFGDDDIDELSLSIYEIIGKSDYMFRCYLLSHELKDIEYSSIYIRTEKFVLKDEPDFVEKEDIMKLFNTIRDEELLIERKRIISAIADNFEKDYCECEKLIVEKICVHSVVCESRSEEIV